MVFSNFWGPGWVEATLSDFLILSSNLLGHNSNITGENPILLSKILRHRNSAASFGITPSIRHNIWNPCVQLESTIILVFQHTFSSVPHKERSKDYIGSLKIIINESFPCISSKYLKIVAKWPSGLSLAFSQGKFHFSVANISIPQLGLPKAFPVTVQPGYNQQWTCKKLSHDFSELFCDFA